MSTIFPSSTPDKRLAASLTASSTSFQLNNILGWNGVALTASDFGTIAYGAFRNDAGTLLELFEWDPSTIASASITILKRGLKFDGNLTSEITANKLVWIKNETTVSLGSDVPQLLKSLVDIYSAQTIAGIKTFSSLPATTAGDPVATTDLARKAYVDSVVAGIATSISNVVPGTAGETIADGNLIYLKTSDNRWWKTDADTTTTVENVMLGIAQGAGTAGAAITNGVLTRGVDDAQSGLVAGEVQYASNTAGGIANAAGTTEVTVGVAKSTTELYFDPRFNQQITEDQQDALVGTSGTPSASNKFVTANDLTTQLATKANIVFGGTGADGALTITSGATNIDLLGARVVIKNYSSISITSTAYLTFTNPHANGTIVILKSQGAVTITTSATRAVDLRGLGGTGGTGVAGGDGGVGTSAFSNVIGALGGSGGVRGNSGLGGIGAVLVNLGVSFAKIITLACGSGGGAGASSWSSSTAGGDGGRGGGSLLIECAGALNITGTIDASGSVGSQGTGNTGTGGGGGGAGGTITILYATLTANTGTYTVAGGTGGAAGTGTDSTRGGSGGGGGANITAGATGATASTTSGAAGGAGGTGFSLVVTNTEFA